MQATDKQSFAEIIAKVWRFYGKTPAGPQIADWFAFLENFPLDAIADAFKAHLSDPNTGQYLPKPADVIRHLRGHDHPGPDEAWGILVRLMRDERESGVLSDEMRASWAACQPIMDMGDEIGARRCFIETYTQRVQDASRKGYAPCWTATLGTDPELRIQRLGEAVSANRIGADHAFRLLPDLESISQEPRALLTGPDPEPPGNAERWRGLMRIIQTSSAEREQRREAERERRRNADIQRRADIQRLIDARTTAPDEHAR